jgi:GNAT superfamily N-acetyltransferase
MLVVEPLARHKEVLPTLTEWMHAEWSSWYGPDGPGDAMGDLERYAASGTRLPVGLVAFRDGELVGLCALKDDVLPPVPSLGPWAGAGLVAPGFRGQGIGASLLRATVDLARSLGFAHIYCATATSHTLMAREGWDAVQSVELHGTPVVIYRKELAQVSTNVSSGNDVT